MSRCPLLGSKKIHRMVYSQEGDAGKFRLLSALNAPPCCRWHGCTLVLVALTLGKSVTSVEAASPTAGCSDGGQTEPIASRCWEAR